MRLNPEQQLAVDHLHGPCIVTAIPGSGKTRVLTSRVIRLINKHNIAPKNILCLTFTNKATNEMKERISGALGIDISRQIWVSTFHHLCLAMLRKYGSEVGLAPGFSIYDDKDQAELLQKIVRMRECEGVNSKVLSYMARVVNDYREDLETFDFVVDSLPYDRVGVIKEYIDLLSEFNAVDFSGMLYKTYNLLQDNSKVVQLLQDRFKYILVDECQDTNKIQYEIVKKLAGHGNLFVVGDYNQSIFSFRSARPENLESIKQDFKDVREITLPRNYRSTTQILAVAEKLIHNNPGTKHVKLLSEKGSGNDVFIGVYANPKDEASSIIEHCVELHQTCGYNWRDIAVLYRTNPQSYLIEMACRNMDVPYKVYGGFSFFDRREVKTTLSYLSFLSNPNDTIAFARAISTPSRKVAKTTIGKLERLCQNKKVSMLQACSLIDQIPGVTSTAKQNIMEFVDVVRKHRNMQKDGAGIEEVAKSFLKKTGYYSFMESESNKDNTSKRRIDNIDQLLLTIADFDIQKPGATIADYLHNIQIRNNTSDNEENSVSLMTIHSAKGLEFPVIFLIGCEEKLMPHYLSSSDDDVAEERRLMYVAITRSQDRLFVSCCQKRPILYKDSFSEPSRFIHEMGYTVGC